jgi:hypothetical protein
MGVWRVHVCMYVCVFEGDIWECGVYMYVCMYVCVCEGDIWECGVYACMFVGCTYVMCMYM